MLHLRGTTSTSFMDLTRLDRYSEKRNKEGCRGNDGGFFSLDSVSTSSLRSIGNPPYRQYDCSDFSLQHNQARKILRGVFVLVDSSLSKLFIFCRKAQSMSLRLMEYCSIISYLLVQLEM